MKYIFFLSLQKKLIQEDYAINKILLSSNNFWLKRSFLLLSFCHPFAIRLPFVCYPFAIPPFYAIFANCAGYCAYTISCMQYITRHRMQQYIVKIKQFFWNTLYIFMGALIQTTFSISEKHQHQKTGRDS